MLELNCTKWTVRGYQTNVTLDVDRLIVINVST